MKISKTSETFSAIIGVADSAQWPGPRAGEVSTSGGGLKQGKINSAMAQVAMLAQFSSGLSLLSPVAWPRRYEVSRPDEHSSGL